ncbi:MAG: mannose-1-phosphate guanylyltransferase [Gammaproteobacteria bacterium]|nr:mannose-1-phosphate guanylyltransferase [Gammaproteobacteria bacterium]
MKAMILAAGRGERLRPLTDRVPKALAPVGGEPMLAHQLRWLAAAGIREVVINLHHLGEQIVAAVGDGAGFGLTVRYSREDTLLETGGGIVNALPLLGEAPFLLLNGDIYTDFPLTALPDRPPAGSLAHLVVTPRPAFRDRGDFDVEDGVVRRRGDGFVYCGIALLDPRALDGRRAERFSLREVYFELLARGALTAQEWRGFWSDIGDLTQLREVDAHHRAKA